MRLSDLITDFRAHTVGIDLCAERVRFVQVQRRGKKVEITHFGAFEKANGTFYRADLLNIDGAAKNLREGFSSHNRNVRAAFASIPEQHSFLKLLTVAASSNASLDESIRWETTQHIPYELKDLTIDWMRVQTSDPTKISALVAACPTRLSDSYRTLIERAGMRPFGLEPASVALARAHRHLFPRGVTGVLVSIGELESMAVVIKDGVPYLSASLSFTVASLVASIMKRFKVVHDDALKSLNNFGYYKLRARGLVRESLAEPLERLVRRLQDIRDFSQSHFPGLRALHVLHVCGPGTYIAGLTDELRSRITMPIQASTLMPGLLYGRHAKEFYREFQRYTVALGCALNSIDGRGV